ncbi:MAG TPA: tetratricopeptide repeat protein [Nitrospira sp.]|nr:tetratricopeptide repeat protein [Nitrospira sp.]
MSGEYSSADLRRILRLNESQLRACLRTALLPVSRTTGARSYSFQNLVLLRTAKGLTEAGVSSRQIRKVLACLQRQLGEGEALTSLKIYASGKRVVVWDGEARWQPDSGQFVLNFDTAQMLPAARFTPRNGILAPSDAAHRWFDRAVALEEDSREEACRAYEEALRLHPGFVEAQINLGLLHHNAGNLIEAEARYREALKQDPTRALAHFNLGVVLEDQQKRKDALAAYEEAVRQAPDFREAHCNLAQLYETLGRRRDALRHYAAAKRLSR